MSLNGLVCERVVHRQAGHDGAVEVLILPHGGMGDRVVFEALVRQARAGRPEAHLVAAVPFQADEYNARHYVPPADEVWVLQEEPTPDTLALVHRRAQAHFGPGCAVRTTFFGAKNPNPPELPGGVWAEPYGRLAELARAGHYPRFAVRGLARGETRAELTRIGFDPGRQRLVGLHCRARPGEASKNPDAGDVLAVARALKRDERVRLLVVGAEDVPAPLLELADARDAGRPQASLQRLASWLEACSVFVGGDSGPMHLAAAVGAPVVVLLAGDRDDAWGPFAPEGRVLKVRARSSTGEGPLRFDADEVAARALGLIEGAR